MSRARTAVDCVESETTLLTVDAKRTAATTEQVGGVLLAVLLDSVAATAVTLKFENESEPQDEIGP